MQEQREATSVMLSELSPSRRKEWCKNEEEAILSTIIPQSSPPGSGIILRGESGPSVPLPVPLSQDPLAQWTICYCLG